MCKKIIHTKAKEVFIQIQQLIRKLYRSIRLDDQGFKDPIRLLVRKVYGFENGRINYLIFVVPQKDAAYCLSAWEISAEFKGLNDEFFNYIKTKMMMDSETKWHIIPIRLGVGIICNHQREQEIMITPVSC